MATRSEARLPCFAGSPSGGFASRTKPGFVFSLVFYESVSARTPWMLPEAMIQTRLEGLVEILCCSRRK